MSIRSYAFALLLLVSFTADGFAANQATNMKLGPSYTSYRYITTSLATITAADDVIILQSGAGIVDLPDAATYSGIVFTIKHDGPDFDGYTINPNGSSSYNIDGKPSYVLRTNGETVKILSDGTQWVLLEHRTTNDWRDFPSVAAGTLVTATTTNPTNYGTTTVNKAQWRRVGNTAEIRWDFRQTTAGNLGNGLYLFNLPGGLSMDTTKVTLNTSSAVAASFTDSGSLGSMSLIYSNIMGTGTVSAYSATQLKAILNGTSAAGSAGLNLWRSTGYGPINSAALAISLRATVPVAGWEP